jgi:hypothetical protein
VNGRGIGRHEHVGLAKNVGDGPAVKAGDDLARIGVDAINPPCQRAICLFGRLYVLAFGGRADAVRSLFSRQLRFVRPRHEASWIFIAGQTAETRDEDARRVLASYVRAAEDEAFRRIAQRHLDAGPMPDEADLSAASRATIAAIEKTLGKRRGTSRRGKPTIAPQSVWDGLEAAGLPTRARVPPFGLALYGKSQPRQCVERSCSLDEVKTRLDCDFGLEVFATSERHPAGCLRLGQDKISGFGRHSNLQPIR